MRKYLLVLLGLVAICMLPTRKAQAQNYTCGMRCESDCWWEMEHGKMAVDGTSNPLAQHYWMGCALGTGCGICGASSRGSDDNALATALASGSKTLLRELVATNPKRILVSRRRRLVVVRGSECNPDAFVAVTSISAARVRELAELGITELETVSAPAVPRRGN